MKRKVIISLILALLLTCMGAFFACGEKPISVTDVSISKSIAVLIRGETLQLEATVSPDNASNKNLIWTSENSSIATVNESGLVTAVGLGETMIVVTTEDGEKVKSCNVFVAELLNFESRNKTIAYGETGRIDVVVRPGYTLDRNLVWSSANEEVAIVDQEGNVTGVGIGETTITVATEDGIESATYMVEITPKLTTSVLIRGETLQFEATVSPGNTTVKNLIWTSENSSVATVNESGLVTAVGLGETMMSGATEDGDAVKLCKVSVVKLFNFESDNKTIAYGETGRVDVVVRPGYTLDRNLVWNSANEEVAIVDQEGNVTGVGIGETTITAATEDGIESATYTVKITPKLTLNHTSYVLYNDNSGDKSVQLELTILPADFQYTGIRWTSNDKTLVTVSSDGFVQVVSGASIGATRVQVFVDVGNGMSYSVYCDISVSGSEFSAPEL